MAVANAYGKVATSGSVFMYDTGDTFNSYKGQPGTNITTGAGRNWNGYNRYDFDNGYFIEYNGYTETVNIPALGPTTVQSIEIQNVYCGYGCNNNYNCCPNLYNYTGGWNSIIWTPGQTYSYQIIYKCRSGYTNPNYMYHYEYDINGNYITEYGVFTTDKQESLGDGWYHAWNTFTVNASAVRGYTGLWYYQYNVADKISIAAVSISPGDTIRPPRQIIPSGTTRTATQGLLPLVSNSSINLSTVSFDSNAQMYFDGTDDYFDIANNSSLQIADNVTIEAIVKVNSSNIGDIKVLANKYHSVGWELILGTSGNFILGGRNGDGTYYVSDSGIVIADNTYHHIVAIKSGLLWQTYVDGNLKSSTTANSIGTLSNSGDIQIGREGSGYYSAMHLPIFKIYNRALSSSEVQQNYNKYKTRFNLS